MFFQENGSLWGSLVFIGLLTYPGLGSSLLPLSARTVMLVLGRRPLHLTDQQRNQNQVKDGIPAHLCFFSKGHQQQRCLGETLLAGKIHPGQEIYPLEMYYFIGHHKLLKFESHSMGSYIVIYLCASTVKGTCSPKMKTRSHSS